MATVTPSTTIAPARPGTREKVLIYGGPGVGKTHTLLSIAKQNPRSRVFVIDPDDGVGKLLESEFRLPNLEYELCTTWMDIEDAFKDVRTEAAPNDWVCIEMLGQIWDMAQSFYIKEVFGQSLEDHYLETRKRIKDSSRGLPVLDGWKDWAVIKKIHNDGLLDPFARSMHCNVVTTSSARKLRPEDPIEMKSVFADVGYAPEGEKHNPYRFDTILYLSMHDGKRFLQAVKDRGRPLMSETLTQSDAWSTYLDWLFTAG